jgi:hypothetical protein
MKKLIASLLLLGTLAVAGPLKVASYPVRHPVKVMKSLGKAVKSVVW